MNDFDVCGFIYSHWFVFVLSETSGRTINFIIFSVEFQYLVYLFYKISNFYRK